MRDAIYLSGPMSNVPDHNFPAFNAAAAQLRAAGFEVVNPAELGEEPTWEQYLRRDLIVLLEKCNCVVMLDKWQVSRGANLEVTIAKALGMRVVSLAEFLVQEPAHA